MSKANLPGTVIITKIVTSEAKFDTGIEALKSLNEAGVNETVISAMIRKMSVAKTVTVQTEPVEKQNLPLNSGYQPPTESPSFTPYSQLSKSEQKERLKQPAQISIAAAKDNVISTIIQTFGNGGFSLQNESASRLIMQKKLSGKNAFLGQLALGTNGGSAPVANYAFTLNTIGSITTVSVDISMVAENAFGKVNRLDVNKNKANREEIDDILLLIKNQCERNNNK